MCLGCRETEIGRQVEKRNKKSEQKKNHFVQAFVRFLVFCLRKITLAAIKCNKQLLVALFRCRSLDC